MMKHASNRHFFANALAHIGLALALLTLSFAQDEPFVFQENVMIPMRDGTELAANIFRPQDAGPFPVILMRTPYGKGDRNQGQGKSYASAGYAMVIQDCRGKGASDGQWDPFRYDAEDGFDTQEWVGKQSWCNGRIGTAGGSYVGWTQWASAPNASRYLKAMVPIVPFSNAYDLAYNLCDGIIRARWRNSRVERDPIEPGKVVRYEIDLWVTSNLFQPGHRIRVEISSSNFPRFDRNPNTGLPFGTDTELTPATQTIYHGAERPSHILLPIIPR